MTSSGAIHIPEEFEGRDVGQLAEDLLRMWVSRETAITLNPSVNDKEGWDCFLEFPFLKPEQGKPWDTATPRIQCFVQVKGTSVGSRKRNVKLDNWQKLIYVPQPAFFLIYEFDGDALQQAYLVHVHGEWMEKILRRLRRALLGKSAPLHKQNVTLTWSDEDKIDPPSGRGLVAAIHKHIGNNFDAYVREKQKTRRELGLETPFLIDIKGRKYPSLDEMFAELVDFALGHKELPFTILVKKDVRFGEPSEVVEEHESLLTVFPEGTEVTLTFRNNAGTRKAAFSANVYDADYFFPRSELPRKYRKYRIKYPLGEWFYSPSADPMVETTSAEFQFQMDLSPGLVDIRELVNSWRVITLLQSAKRDGMNVEINRSGFSPVKIASIEQNEIPPKFLLIAQAVENTWFLVRYLDLPLEEVQVTLEEIVRQRQELADIRILLNRSHPPFRSVTGNLDEPSPNPEKEHAMVFGRVVELGCFRVLVAVGIAGPYRKWGDGTEFEILRPMPIFTNHFFLSEQLTVANALASMYERLREEGFEVLGAEVYLSRLMEEEE